MRILYSTFLLLIPTALFSQQFFYRLSADFSIKEKASGISSVYAGTIYYDLNTDIFVYNVFFPEKIDWVVHDTSFYTFKNNILQNRVTIPKINDVNFIHLSLTASLNDYGLKKSGLYEMKDVIYEDGLIISTYSSINPRLKESLGDIHISTKQGNLHGVVFLNPEGDVVKKIFIENYILKEGVLIPTEILEITFKDKVENYKITKFDNVILNEEENENFYSYPIPFIGK